jgi:hypothetical protein
VTRYVSDTDFDVDGHPITTTPTTVMHGPFNALSLVQLDAFVHVTGKVIGNGVVEAGEITTANSVNLGSVIWDVSSTGLSAPMWRYSPCKLVDTAFSVDDVPASWQDIHLGDRANIYANSDLNYVFPPSGTGGSAPPVLQKCYVVEVEHAVVGRVESLVVNGQRIWMNTDMYLFDRPGIHSDPAGFVAAGEVRAALRVGDRVAVSGDMTDQGEFIATGITSATALPGYRVTGLARDVDTLNRQLRLGNLRVDYSSASLSGFTSGEPVAGDRILMIASDAPVGGVQVAGGLRYIGGPRRGERLNFVRLGGLITSLAGDAIAFDGRMTAPLANPPAPANGLERVVCDPAKLHLNLRINNVTVGGWDDERPRRLFQTCPSGRRNDIYEALPDAPASPFVAITARLQGLDAASYTLQIAGTSVALNPASILTAARMDSGVLRTTPLRLQDLRAGDRVRIELPSRPGVMVLADSLWAGPAVAGSLDDVRGTLLTATEPDLSLGPVTVHTTAATAVTYKYYDDSCKLVDGTVVDLWSGLLARLGKSDFSLSASGTLSGSVLAASTINVLQVTSPCDSAYY